jgi:tol-pal system protein YbgF
MVQICLFSLLVMLSGCVSPDQYRVLENRVNALEMENARLKTLQAQFEDQAADLTTIITDLEDRVQTSDEFSRKNIAEINQELQQVHKKHGQLQGMMEETAYRLGHTDPDSRSNLTQVLDRMDRAVSRNHTRITRLETYMGFEPTVPGIDDPDTSGAAVPENGDGQAPTMPVSDKAAYEQAKKTFDDGDMETARIQFENFINTFPKSSYAGNARFWIADSYYVEKWYEKAILEYQKVLEQYPDSNKVAAARLKQGYAFAELGEKANARLILNELVTRYPDSREATFAREKLKQLQ